MSVYRQEPNYKPPAPILLRFGKLLLLLLLLGGLASAVFLLFLRGYVVDGPQGPRLRLPFLADQSQASPVFSASQAVTLPDSEGEGAALLSPLHALKLSDQAIWDQTALSQMRKTGCNAVVLDMRDPDGSLHYVSELELAIDSDSSAALPGLNQAIRSLNQTPGLYTIARVSCFSDARLSALRPDLALRRAGGVPWRDEALMAWLSPGEGAVQAYLLDICRELSDLGFDEILLTDCAYPLKGARGQQYERESTEALSLTLEAFYQELRSSLEAQGVRLSVLWEPVQDNENGQSPAALALAADRIWLAREPDAALEAFSSRGLSAAGLSLVSLVSKPGGQAYSWALF